MSRSSDQWLAGPSLPDGRYVRNAVYADPEIFQSELANIFHRSWKFVAHESELPNPHDYRAIDLAGMPLLLVRGGDGQIRGFYNACSHRGAPVVRAPKGNARTLTCFFHLWSYDDQGRCVGITREDAYAACGIRKENLGLRKVEVGVRMGLVFVNLDRDPEPLDRFLGPALENFAGILDGTEFQLFHLNRVVVHSNWKLFHETNLDSYHEWMHVLNRRTSIQAPGYFDRNMKLYPNGHCTQDPFVASYGRMQGLKDRTSNVLPGAMAGEFRYVDLFPNTTIVSRSTVIRIDTSTPLGPNRTLVEFRGLAPKGDSPEVRKERIKHFIQFWGPFGRNTPEDVLAVEEVQRTMDPKASLYSIHARDEGQKGQDDAPTRHFFAEWGRRMGRSASNPSVRAV